MIHLDNYRKLKYYCFVQNDNMYNYFFYTINNEQTPDIFDGLLLLMDYEILLECNRARNTMDTRYNIVNRLLNIVDLISEYFRWLNGAFRLETIEEMSIMCALYDTLYFNNKLFGNAEEAFHVVENDLMLYLDSEEYLYNKNMYDDYVNENIITSKEMREYLYKMKYDTINDEEYDAEMITRIELISLIGRKLESEYDNTYNNNSYYYNRCEVRIIDAYDEINSEIAELLNYLE